MNTPTLLCFLLLLALPFRLAGKQYSDSSDAPKTNAFELQEIEVEDEFDEFLEDLPNRESDGWKKDLSNVDAFGAVGDGVSDDTKVRKYCCNITTICRYLANKDNLHPLKNLIRFYFQAFVDAWKKACSKQGSVFLVPERQRYLVNATKFEGPCAGKLVIQVKYSILCRYVSKIILYINETKNCDSITMICVCVSVDEKKNSDSITVCVDTGGC